MLTSRPLVESFHELGQRCWCEAGQDNTCGKRIIGELTQTEVLLESSFCIGLYPGLTQPMLDYSITSVLEFVRSYT